WLPVAGDRLPRQVDAYDDHVTEPHLTPNVIDVTSDPPRHSLRHSARFSERAPRAARRPGAGDPDPDRGRSAGTQRAHVDDARDDGRGGRIAHRGLDLV